MTALGEAVISGSAFGGRPTTPASPRRPISSDRLVRPHFFNLYEIRRQSVSREECRYGAGI
jgi:hypothetical protein